MRAAAQGGRPRWDRPVAGRVRAARAAIAAALIGLIVVGVTSPSARARTWLADAGGALMPYTYQAIQVQDAAMPASPEAAVDGYPPANAVDGSSSLAWAIPWTDQDLPTRCGTSSSPTLLIRFTEPTTISRIIVNAGLDPTDANRTRQVLPRVIDIQTSTGDCTRLTLTPDSGPQESRSTCPAPPTSGSKSSTSIRRTPAPHTGQSARRPVRNPLLLRVKPGHHE